jgi:lipopolysaccharide export system permease protein
LTSTKAKIITNEKTGERSVLFIDGRRYVGTAGELDYSIIEYERYQLKLEQDGYDTTIPVMSRISSKQLLDSNEPTLMAELQWRISSPLSIVILSIFAVLMVRSSRESKRTFTLMTAVLTFFLYNNLQKIFHDLVLREKLSPFPGLWWPHFMMITIILLLLFIPVYWRNRKFSENDGEKA